MTDAELIARLREIGKFSFGWTADQAADRIEVLSISNATLIAERDAAEAKLAKAVNIATLALNAVHEVQTYEQPDDPWTENALTMHELDAFDFDVGHARATLAEIKSHSDEFATQKGESHE